MLSVATAAVAHRSIRPKAPAPSPSTANIIVDAGISWNAELTQSPKRRRTHQGPCSARKKLIQSPTEDISLNLNLNNAEITLTPIRKTGSSLEAASKSGINVGEKVKVEKKNDAVDNELNRDGVYLTVGVLDEARSIEKNEKKEKEEGESNTKKCSLMPFVNSDEITIRPIAKNAQNAQPENSILKCELSITKPNCRDNSLEISGNVSDIMKMQAQTKSFTPKTSLVRNLTLRTPKGAKLDPNDPMKSSNGLENVQISAKSFYQKSPDAQKPVVVRPLTISKKFQVKLKKESALTRLEKASEYLKTKTSNTVSLISPKSKTSNGILSSTPKVAVIKNPVVPNLQEICTSHNNFEGSDISEEMLSPWNEMNVEESHPPLLDNIKQPDGLEATDDNMLLMGEIDLHEPYHMTGFPNPPGENRCWLNATLQALFAMPLLDTFQRHNLQDCSKLTKYLITTKTHWMKGASGREKAYQTVKLLKEELGVLDETYPSERQQDVSEFLMILLNHIKSDFEKLISAEESADEMENVPINQQDSHKVVKTPQTPNKRQPLADISTPKNNNLKRSHSLGDPNHSPRIRKQVLTHSVQDLLSPKLRKLSNPSDPSYKVHTPPLAPTNDETISYRNPVDENFQLYLMEHYTCKGCEKNRQKKVDNLMLFVDIPSDDSLAPIDLQKAVENIFAPEERSLTCGTCKHDSHTMRTTFRRQPNILTLQVNRYGMSSEGIFAKINTDVKIPKNLDLSATFLHDASGGPTTYEPICIIAHAGGTMDCGHYTSYVRHGEQWYHYNDMSVLPMTEEEALSAAQMTAYLLFFVKSTSAEQDSDRV